VPLLLEVVVEGGQGLVNPAMHSDLMGPLARISRIISGCNTSLTAGMKNEDIPPLQEVDGPLKSQAALTGAWDGDTDLRGSVHNVAAPLL
jgi:hypothetical protein